jgi:hypothetical protein
VSDPSRMAITCVAALLIGALSYGHAIGIDRTGLLGSILYSTELAWALYALPVLTVALVNRWWALSVALVPFAVLYFLHSATDYVYPYHEDPYPVLAAMGTVVLLGVSSLGFLVRAVLVLTVSKKLWSRAQTSEPANSRSISSR